MPLPRCGTGAGNHSTKRVHSARDHFTDGDLALFVAESDRRTGHLADRKRSASCCTGAEAESWTANGCPPHSKAAPRTAVSPPWQRRSPNVAAFASTTGPPEGRDPSGTSIRTASCSAAGTGISSGWIRTAARCGRSASLGSRPTSRTKGRAGRRRRDSGVRSRPAGAVASLRTADRRRVLSRPRSLARAQSLIGMETLGTREDSGVGCPAPRPRYRVLGPVLGSRPEVLEPPASSRQIPPPVETIITVAGDPQTPRLPERLRRCSCGAHLLQHPDRAPDLPAVEWQEALLDDLTCSSCRAAPYLTRLSHRRRHPDGRVWVRMRLLQPPFVSRTEALPYTFAALPRRALRPQRGDRADLRSPQLSRLLAPPRSGASPISSRPDGPRPSRRLDRSARPCAALSGADRVPRRVECRYHFHVSTPR